MLKNDLKNKSPNDIPESQKIILRSDSVATFDFKCHCFICAEKCSSDEPHPDRAKEW